MNMDAEGYPEDSELELIEKWDYHDLFSLIDFIKDRWAYAESGYFVMKWGKDRQNLHKHPVLHLELHTAGWSGNESIVNSLMENKMAVLCMGYYQWNAGGHYKFQINPITLGYKPVSEMAKEVGCSRQNIHKTADRYHWITIRNRNQLVKPKQLTHEQ